ncbi:MAG: DUF748 domain-containing protein [Desulfobacteraceae bacterium]|nr:DUF748 domain-containing protein [Desulfobacteraceae bacterium]
MKKMNLLSRYKPLEPWKKVSLWTAVCLLLHAVTGFFILPAIIKTVSVNQLTTQLKRSVTIRKVRVNPYSLSFTVEGFTLMDKDGVHPFFAFESLYLNLGSGSIIKLAPVVREFSIDSPSLRLVRLENDLYNFSDLLPQPGPTPSPTTVETGDASKGFFRFILANLAIRNGRIDIKDDVKGKTHTLADLNLAVPFVSSLVPDGESFVTPHFSIRVNDALLTVSAKTKPFASSLETCVNLDLKGMDLNRYLSYLPVETNIKSVTGTADLSLALCYSKEQPDTPNASLSGALNLTGLSVDTIQGDTLLNLNRFEAVLNPSKPLNGDFNIGRILLDAPTIHLVRDARGILNLNNLVPPGKETTPKSEQTPFPFTITVDEARLNQAKVLVTDRFNTNDTQLAPKELATLHSLVASLARIDSTERRITLGKFIAGDGVLTIQRSTDNRLNLEAFGTNGKEEKKEKSADRRAAPWKTETNEAVLDNFAIRGMGLARPGEGDIILDKLKFRATALSTLPGKESPVDLNVRINTTGGLGVKGKIGLNPVTADLGVTLKGINLSWAQPFLSDHLNIMISNGKLAAKGNLALVRPGTPDFKGGFTGEARVTGLSITEPHLGDEIVAWEHLGFNGMDIGISPGRASIAEISLKRPLGRIVLDRDKRLNLQKILKPGKQAAKTPKKKAPEKSGPEQPFPVTIGRVLLEKGNFEFTDRSIQPEFKVTLSDIGTTIKDLDSRETQRADVDLNARVNNHASLAVTGKINPLKQDLFLDTRVQLQDLDLGPASPYAGRYAGYTIRKGKLSLDLSYHIDNRALDSKNDLFIDQFDFGAPTGSEAAVNAPVKLAVALLKDTSGKISLNLPVKGNLDDPEFSVAGIIVKMVTNLVAKAATSPFALLGSMFGGGEDLNVIEFPPGATVPTPRSMEKISVLAKALGERPGLGLEITGHADLDKDRKAMEDLRFNRTLKAVKLAEMIDQGARGMPVDEIPLPDGEFAGYLTKAYRATLTGAGTATGPEAEGPEGTGPVVEGPEAKSPKAKGPGLSQMEESVRKTIAVSDDDLGHLAHARALEVADRLLAGGAIAPGRIFMVEPKSLEPAGEKKGVSPASVLLKLR